MSAHPSEEDRSDPPVAVPPSSLEAAVHEHPVTALLVAALIGAMLAKTVF